MNKELHYKDIVLNNPKYSEVESRDHLNVKVKLGDKAFYSPAISANMRTAISFELAEQLAENGYFYILHRFYDYDKILDWLTKKNNEFYKSISVGVKEKDYQLINDIARLGLNVEYITIDIANGHALSMKNMIKHIRNQLGGDVFIIAGNACTPEACQDFYDWGASCAKIGIACGKGCFLGDTLVHTDNGVKEFKNLTISDRVLTHTGQYKNIEKIYKKHASDVIDVNGNICTPNHEFYVIDKAHEKDVTEENIHKYAYFIEADNITDKHLIVSIDHK